MLNSFTDDGRRYISGVVPRRDLNLNVPFEFAPNGTNTCPFGRYSYTLLCFNVTSEVQ